MELRVGNLKAVEGEKVQGYFEVLHTDLKVPCTLINGKKPGKTVVITGGTHGGEYPGVEAAIRIAGELQPEMVSGKVIVMHPYNLPAFEARLQYLTPQDGKNLNREFPGIATGTFTQRMAYSVTQELHSQADFYMDLHGGDIHEALVPFVIYPTIGSEEVTRISKEAASCMGINYVCKSTSTNGTFGSAALRGVPGFLSEIGGSGLWTEQEVQDYMYGIKNVLKYLHVLEGEAEINNSISYIEQMNGIYAESNGCWYPSVTPGGTVKKDEKVGEIKDYFGKVINEYYSPVNGTVLFVVSSLAITKDDPIVAIGEC